MSEESLNLASRPFANRAPVLRAAVLLGVVAVALLALNVALYRSYFSGAGQDAREELRAVEQQIRALEKELGILQDQLGGYDLEAHNRQVEFLNRKIAERTFGWSRLFEDLDAVLPPAVRLERLTPRISERSRNADLQTVSLELRGIARGEDGLLELIDALFEHERFRNPSPSRMSSRDGEQQFSLTVTYLPDAGGEAVEDARVGEDAT